MDTRVERVDDTTVKLAVTVEPPRVTAALEEAARHLADEVKIPGFRKGKVPRRVLETRLGKGAVLQHAVQDALPQFYAEAVREQELEPVGQPEFELETFEEGRDAEFTATVEVRPEFDPPPVDGVQVPHPEWEVTDEDVEAEIDRLRERFAEAETVDRPIQVGDLAVLSISGSHRGEPVEDASMDHQLYRVDDPEESGQQLDRELLGATPGTIAKFTDTFDDDERELDFTVIVKDVKALTLPDADDEFAITASEFDTIDELRDSIREQIAEHKLRHAREALRGRVVETVSDLVDVPLPRVLVDQEVQFQLARLARDAERREIPFDRYLQAAGTTMEQLTEQLRDSARKTVRAQLVVDRVGRDAGVTVSNEDLSRQVMEEAARLNMPPDQLAEFMTEPERLGVLFADAFRRKTIDHIIERVEVTGGPLETVDPPVTADADAPDADADADAAASTVDDVTA
ncbi:MAG: trigger factor [Actinobacteria bacterium]|nr:trigger factor [Actinomycetota bacterium]